jgi:hypothetical protein
VTWVDEKVSKVVSDWFVPLKINKEKQGDMFQKNLVSWTPTVAVLDGDGREHFRFTGFLSPAELCARIILDGAKAELMLKNYELGVKCLNEVIDKYQGTFAVPEAIFYLGVVNHIWREEPKFLRKALDRLREEFPDSEWTLRATPYEAISL